MVKNLPAIAEDIRDVGLIPEKISLEEGMATYSNILPWKIPWTEEPGRLQPIGLQRIRHDSSDLATAPSKGYLREKKNNWRGY